jgi:hypothetical protein
MNRAFVAIASANHVTGNTSVAAAQAAQTAKVQGLITAEAGKP